VARRKSGYFDMYWDCQRKCTIQDKSKSFLYNLSLFIGAKDVTMSFSNMYFKMDDLDETIYVIEHNGLGNIDFSMAEKIEDQEF
jgi:hypothetical protein